MFIFLKIKKNTMPGRNASKSILKRKKDEMGDEPIVHVFFRKKSKKEKDGQSTTKKKTNISDL